MSCFKASQWVKLGFSLSVKPYTGFGDDFDGYLRCSAASEERNLIDDDVDPHMEYFTRSMDPSPDRATVASPDPLPKHHLAPWHAGTVCLYVCIYGDVVFLYMHIHVDGNQH